MGYIEFQNVTKVYRSGEANGVDHHALNGLSFAFGKGEFCVIAGPSGSGKTTIIHLLAGLERPTEGTVTVREEELTSLNEKDLAAYRRALVGIIFPSDNLIPTLSLIENVALAAQLRDRPFDPMRALDNVGLKDKRHAFPDQLTGGEQQRAAIARAMVKKPRILLCDEPLLCVEPEERQEVMQCLYDICRETGKTVVVATRDEGAADTADRMLRVRGGQLWRTYANRHRIEIEDYAW